MRKHFNQAILKVSALGQIGRLDLLNRLKKHSYVFIRGLIAPEEILEAKRNLEEEFDPEKDHPSTGEDPKAIMNPFQKLSAGGVTVNQKVSFGKTRVRGVFRPRLMRTIYLPLWEKDIYGFHGAFRMVCAIRNLLYGLPPRFCVDRPEGGFWTASRIHHYPRGGGFLIPHRDEALPRVQKKTGMAQYYQPFLVLSRKGIDFERGGGFVERDGERIYFEEYSQPGDIGVYNGRTMHGVEDIDPHKKLRLDTLEGRMAGFVSLYRDLRGS